MEYKDYYKILGVSKSASQDEIKKAFRKLAVKYHPDKNSGDKTAEAKFKEINEANEVIGDEAKRKKYDELGSNWNNYQQGQGQSQGGFDWGKYQQQYGGSQGGQTYTTDFGDFSSSFGGGGGGFSDFFEAFFGGAGFGGGKQKSSGRRQALKGQDMQAELQVSLEDAYNGSEKVFEINGQTIKLKLKKGVNDGLVLKLAGKGYSGQNNGQNGDLLLTVKIEKHPFYNRIDDDLYMDLPLDIFTAVLGGKLDVTTLKGKIKITIPPETSNGKTLRLGGLGMPKYGKESQHGDLFVKIDLETPKNLTAEEKKLFEQLAEMRKK
ncbi:MAG: J domain-containing protein [Ignavibacteria bacterium]